MDTHTHSPSTILRRLAEERLASHPPVVTTLSQVDANRLIHELQVHQIELEMQNEELQRTRAQVETGLQRYSDLFDFAPVGYLVLDHLGSILQANLTGATMLEVNRVDLIGRRLGLFVAQTDRAVFSTFLTLVFDAGSQQVCEVALEQPHHLCQYVQLSGMAAPDGQECKITLIDITERRLLFRAAIETISEGIVVHQSDGTIIMANPSAERILGLTKDQLMGLSSVDPRWGAVHEDGSAFPGEAHPAMRTLQDGQPLTDIIMGVSKPGSEHSWISINTQPMILPGATVPYGVVATFRDITEHRRTQNALSESEARFRTVVEWSPNAIVIHRDGVIIYANPAAVQLFGAELTQDLTGHPVLERVHPDFHQVVLERVKNGIDQGINAPLMEMRHVKLDGTVIDTEVQGTVITYDGAPAIQATLHDITVRKHLESALQKLATTDELTKLVNRRHFLALAAGELRRAARQIQPPSLVMLDVDGLKHVNDTYGHAAGDQVLTTFSDACGKLIREIDVFARVGGDEFVLLLPETTCEEACRVVERVKLALTTLPIEMGGQPYVVQFSAGVTCMADANESLDALLARADMAMYRAKDAGRVKRKT